VNRQQNLLTIQNESSDALHADNVTTTISINTNSYAVVTTAGNISIWCEQVHFISFLKMNNLKSYAQT